MKGIFVSGMAFCAYGCRSFRGGPAAAVSEASEAIIKGRGVRTGMSLFFVGCPFKGMPMTLTGIRMHAGPTL